MNKVYARINWENYPSENTPLNESNLNKIDYGLNEVDNRVIELDTTKVNSSSLSDNIKSWSMDEVTGIITIEKYSGEQVLFDLNIEKIPVSFTLSDDGILTMTTDDGTQFTADIGSMIPVLTFNDSDTIAVTVTGTGVNKEYSFSIKSGSVTGDMLEENYLANINVKVAEAEGYTNTSGANATASGNSATLSQSWAVGGTGTREGEDTNNAKYYAEQAAAVSQVDIATTEKAGIVKPDGNTITVQEDGTISAVGGIAEKVTATDSQEFGFSDVQGFIDIASEKFVDNTTGIEQLNTELGNYLPLTGGKLSGNLYIGNLSSYGGSTSDCLIIAYNSERTTNRQLLLTNTDYMSSIKYALRLKSNESGSTAVYYIFGSHNKPTGNYTGNGSSTSRTIDTGGYGDAIAIQGNGYTCFVGMGGAIVIKSSNGTITGIPSTECKFHTGVLTIATTNAAVNGNGATHYYQVL